jgi:SAM-dependent methyltransferase
VTALGAADSYSPEHFALLAPLEPRSFWFRGRRELVVRALGRYFANASTFLEVGCGTGFVLAGVEAAYPELDLTGCDLFSEGLATARVRTRRARLLELDAYDLPFDGEFDVVGTFDVLEHLDDDVHVLSQLRKVLRPGGGLLVTVPQHPRLWSPVDEWARHRRRYRRAELVAKVRGAGFDLVRATSFVALLLPLLAASRFVQRRVPERVEPFAELRTPPFLNRGLGGAMAVERALIERGVSFPAGGSLLLIARRR